MEDSYKYKFGGMEYQDEFDINTYDLVREITTLNYTAKYGTKTTSAREITNATRSGMANTAKYARGVGTGTSITGMFISSYQFGTIENPTWGDYGRLGMSYLSAGLTFSGYTAPIGIGMGLVDMVGGFDGLYNHLDNQQQLYNASGGVMVPLGPTGTPVFVPLK